MNVKDDRTLIKMIKYCNDIELLLKRYNRDFQLYASDISFQYSCNMCIIQIGELVSRLSDDIKNQNPHIPWLAIKGMRNLHAHDYENVDFEIVWNTLTEEIPELKTTLENILDKMKGDSIP